jgi:MFS family permease
MRNSAPAASYTERVTSFITPPVLRASQYRRLWMTGVCYYQAYWMEIVVTGWVVLSFTGSPTAVGLVAFFRTLPMLVLGLIFGTLVDRFPRVGVLLGIQTLSLGVAATFGLLFYFGLERLWVICILTGLVGCAWAADFAARRALFSELNTRETTANAMSIEAMAMQGGKISAPVLGGVMLGFGGAPAAYLGLSVLFVLGIVALLRFRSVYSGQTMAARPSVSLIDLIRDGWSTAIRIPVVQVALIITVLMNLLVFPYQQLIALVAGEILHVGPGRMGLLAGAAGFGSAISAGVLTFRGRPDNAVRFFAGGATAGAFLLIALAISTSFHLSLGLQLIIGACFGAFGAMQPALIMNAVEPEMRARAMGLLAMAIGTTPIGILLTGTLSSWIGPAATIGGAATIASLLLLTILVRNRRVIFT